MDMKKILQALDTASTKPVEGSNDIKKFLSVVTEGSNPHKVALPVQMAMQHYAEPVVAQPKPIKEVKKAAMSSMLYQYYGQAEKQMAETASQKKEVISEQARIIADRVLAKENRVDELSKETLQSYQGKAEAQVKDLEPHAKKGEYKDLAKNAIKRREAGIETAKKKIAAKESQDPAEYDQEGRSVKNSLLTTLRAVKGLGNMLGDNDNLPEWCEEKISLAEDYLVTVWDYLQSEQGMQESRYGHRDAYQRDYDSSRTGFGRPPREDDEYHNGPDPEQFKIKCTMTDLESGQPRHRMATINTVHGYGHAVNMALNMYRKQGYADVKVVE
jgi:hypothetical protein